MRAGDHRRGERRDGSIARRESKTGSADVLRAIGNKSDTGAEYLNAYFIYDAAVEVMRRLDGGKNVTWARAQTSGHKLPSRLQHVGHDLSTETEQVVSSATRPYVGHMSGISQAQPLR